MSGFKNRGGEGAEIWSRNWKNKTWGGQPRGFTEKEKRGKKIPTEKKKKKGKSQTKKRGV